jgi:hypothetical protein
VTITLKIPSTLGEQLRAYAAGSGLSVSDFTGGVFALTARVSRVFCRDTIGIIRQSGL